MSYIYLNGYITMYPNVFFLSIKAEFLLSVFKHFDLYLNIIKYSLYVDIKL